VLLSVELGKSKERSIMHMFLVLPWALACGVSGFACGALALATPTIAESQVPAVSETGRYTMAPTEGGFLRLDTLSGEVSFCTVEDGALLCRAAAAEKAALEAEISRLRRENTELKSSVGGAPVAPPKGGAGLPSEEEFERTLSMTERFLRRMMKIFREEVPGNTCPQ
jgi:hypothetical protein